MHKLFARFNDQDEREKGFTLIELLVVIIIIGILVAIAIPLYMNYRKKAVDAQVKSDVTNGAQAVAAAMTDDPTWVAPSGVDSTVNFSIGSGTTVVVSNGDQVTIKGNSSAYCVFATNPNGSTQHYWYDSNAGRIAGTTPTSGICAGVS